MSEEFEIAPPELSPPDQQPDQGGDPNPLPEDKQKELATIIKGMEADKVPAKRISSVVDTYMKQYGQKKTTNIIPQLDYHQPIREPAKQEGVSPAQQTAQRLDINEDRESVARRERYNTFRKEAIKEVESPEWKDKIFPQAKVPALTDFGNMPISAFQKVDPKAVDEYLSTKDISYGQKYWLRNQILNYGKARQSQFYVDQRVKEKLNDLPPEDRNNDVVVNRAYQQAQVEQNMQEANAISNRLNNIGLDDKPIRGSSPFHDQITGTNKALMGLMNFAGDVGGQISSLLELTHAPGLSKAGYMLKTSADDMKSHYHIPQNGEAGNFLAGDILPAFLSYATLAKYAQGPAALYQGLKGAQATSTLGKFAEGVIGGVAVSPVNSYIMASQYYNELIKAGEDPPKAASKADQLLTKNLLTDMLMTPVQFGLLKLPMGKVGSKLLAMGAEGLVAGTHFSLQDFNQKNTENPALHVMDYIKNNEWVSPMITGAAMGMFHKAAVDGMENWSVNNKTRDIFNYGRKYGTDVRTSLPSNETIAGNILTAFEMRDTPGRANELKQLVSSMGGEGGVYRPHEQERLINIIDDVAAVKDKVPKFGSPQQRMAVFNELLNIRSTDEFIGKAGNEAGEKYLKGVNKESEARIQRIMSGEEPLYFVNGNETSKEQLLAAIEKHPEMLSSKAVSINVRNDPATQNKIIELKEQHDAIQKQSAAASDVRPASGDSEAMGGRNEVERPVDQETTGEKIPATEEDLNKLPGAENVADAIESGKIPDEELVHTIKNAIDETKEPLQRVPEGAPEQAGSTEVDRGAGQGAEETGTTPVIPEAEQGPEARNENTSAEPLPGNSSSPDEAGVEEPAKPQYSRKRGPEEYEPPISTGASKTEELTDGEAEPAEPERPDPKKLGKNAKQFITEGRTDEQILSYLQRKGLSPDEAQAVLGDAKAHPLGEAQRQQSIDEAKQTYFSKEGDWLGRKELNKVNSQQQAREYQKYIKDSVKKDKSQKGIKWQDVDRAIHIYLDLQRNPEHLNKYYEKLTPAQKKIVDLSQKLNADQLEIAQAIKEEYEDIGKMSKDEGLIKEVVDNYVARAWDLKGKPATETNFKFKTTSKHQLHRTLDTVLQGYAEGMKLKIEGASNNLQTLRQEIGNVLENKRHLAEGLALKIDSGEINDKGQPILKTLFSTSQEDGYKKIDNPVFKKWEYAGKIKDYPEQDAQTFGRRKDVLVTEDGTVMKKSDVYAPEEVAKSLNNILGSSKLNSLQGLTKFNAAVKQAILSYSGFHFIAFTRAHVLSSKFTTPKDVNPIVAYKTGLGMLSDEHPLGQELIRNGMTLNRQQDFTEGVAEHNTWLGRQADKLSFTKAAKDKLIDLNSQFHKYLFNTYGAGLKMFDGINMVKAELARNPTASTDEQKAIYTKVAKLLNDTYGGINWDRMHGSKMQDPTMRSISSLMLLAPDWTASNLRFAKKALDRGDDGGLYRRAWGRVILRGAALTMAANAIMSVWDDKDDNGNALTWLDAMKRRQSKAWEAGRLRSFMVDITPLYRAIGGPQDKRAYFSIFGAYTDPIKMIAHPVDFLESKGSFTSKAGLELLTSQNWQHKEFTTLDELFGMDDKGEYTKTTKSHEVGQHSATTGKAYVRNQVGHKKGEAKGGKLTMELTKDPHGGAHPVTWMQMPSYILNQVRGMMPTAIQNAWQLGAGENDATTAILNAVGSNVLTNKEPPKEEKKE